MADAVVERDGQWIADLIAQVAAGESSAEPLLRARLVSLASRVTRWQWVVHGETRDFRVKAVEYLCGQGKWKKAWRYAMCGRGDRLVKELYGCRVKLQPMGCGCRFCPRCSRRSGRRFLARVSSHLGTKEHGALWHFCLTQRCDCWESLLGARKRFEEAWRRFAPALKRCGCVAGLATFHVKPRDAGGWHYHMHLVGEFDEGVTSGDRLVEALHLAWYKARRCIGVEPLLWGRKVCEAGPGMEALTGDGQMDFWREAEGPVERVLQYCLRDVLQGVEGWVESVVGSMNSEDFCETLSHVKLRRLFGKWRAKSESEVELESKGGETEGGRVGGGKEPVGKERETAVWTDAGGMDDVLRRAASGERSAREDVEALVMSYRNRGRVANRLQSWVQAIAA